ncbi:probable G-protein coupled receptor 82 [Megalops cyprinoides]|uniref:probable G-protein coupled receptor 82 n=1 Tax=Megalops cyprinoides TaxID=118141 RepID=UPI001864369A|nr:probable G-protein coupled receptor 82 [Megalops cyprinoides]
MVNVSGEPVACSSCLCPSQTTRLFLPTLYSLMFLIGLLGNSLSLWVFVKKIPNKTSTHVYLINLGVSNLMLCATMPILAAYFAVGHTWGSHQLACRVAVGGVTPVLHVNIYVGVFILTWIALSRLAVLVQHSHSGRASTCTRILPSAFFRKLREVHFARAMCLAIWTIVLAGIIPVVVLYSVAEAGEAGGAENAGDQACYSVGVEVGGDGSQLSHVAAIVLFFICFLLVLASYVSVTRHICRSQRNTAITDRHRVYRRVFRNIVVIQLVLAVCLLPHHIFKSAFIGMIRHEAAPQPSAGWCQQLSQLVEVKNILLCLAAFRSVLDPIMYFLLDKTFHRHVADLLKISSRKQNSQSSGSNLDAEATSSKATKL